MTWIVTHPDTFLPERRYVFEVLLGEFLGLPFRAEAGEGSQVTLRLDGDASRRLVLADVLFQARPDDWLRRATLPREPLPRWRPAVEENVPVAETPVLYGRQLEGGGYLRASEDALELGIDVFGGAFFLLTRYEERVCPQRDDHERFPASESLAGREGFLERPLVNEYLEVLWWALARLWPRLERRRREFRLVLSHDVDWPWCAAGLRFGEVARSAAADLVRRRSPGLAARRLAAFHAGERTEDPCNTFEEILALSERFGLRSAFYFIAGHSAGTIDGVYELSDPWIRRLMRSIHERGHEIGLHPSYHTFRDPERLRGELEGLREVCADEGIEQPRWGGRQHYLRWENPITWRIYDEAGLDYDTTLGFSDHAGFRCGVCHEYPVFDLERRAPLGLRERPLVAMEVSLSGYMGLSWPRAAERIRALGETCRRYGGDFTLLWHNSTLLTVRQRQAYRTVVEHLGG